MIWTQSTHLEHLCLAKLRRNPLLRLAVPFDVNASIASSLLATTGVLGRHLDVAFGAEVSDCIVNVWALCSAFVRVGQSSYAERFGLGVTEARDEEQG